MEVYIIFDSYAKIWVGVSLNFKKKLSNSYTKSLKADLEYVLDPFHNVHSGTFLNLYTLKSIL